MRAVGKSVWSLSAFVSKLGLSDLLISTSSDTKTETSPANALRGQGVSIVLCVSVRKTL